MAKNKEPIAWVTRGGKHIPIFAEDANDDEKKKNREIAENKKQADEKNDKPTENKYGFEVYTKDPEVTFTDSHWKKMSALRKKGKFYDGDLKSKVSKKLYDTDNEDALALASKIESDRVTEDEYWAAWHALAEWLKVK